MMKTYVGIRFAVLESNGLPAPRIRREKRTARCRGNRCGAENPVMQPVADYLEFSLIGLKSGDRIPVETDIPD